MDFIFAILISLLGYSVDVEQTQTKDALPELTVAQKSSNSRIDDLNSTIR